MSRGGLIVLVIGILCLPVVFASDSSCVNDVCAYTTPVTYQNGSTVNQTGTHVWFFYASWCPHCHRVLASGVLDRLPGNVDVEKFEVDTNRTAGDLFKRIVDGYKIPAGVPTAVIFRGNPLNGSVLQGDTPIINNLAKLVSNSSTAGNLIGGVQSVTKVKRSLLSDLTFLVGVAASDSINPCIMAVMLIMLATLASIKEYKRMREFGIAYIVCVYVSYLAIGVLLILGSMYLVNQLSTFASQVATVTKWVVAGILVFAGLINIKDFFFWGRGITFNINERHKQKVIELAKRASIAAVVSIAVFVTVVEFPCSGIMYLGAIFYWVSQGVNPWQVFAYLLLYNVIFVLPLVIMLWIALAGKKVREGNVRGATAILLRNKEKFRLVMGLALLGLAYLVLVS